MKNQIILGIFLIFFLSSLASANINLTFQSQNEKAIYVYNLTDFKPVYNTSYPNLPNSTNQTMNLTYDNYLIKIQSTNTHIQGNNGSFLVNNANSFLNDRYLIIWIGVILLLCAIGYYSLRS